MATQVFLWLSPNYLHPDRSHEPSIEIELFSRSGPAKTQRLEPGLLFFILNRNYGKSIRACPVHGTCQSRPAPVLPRNPKRAHVRTHQSDRYLCHPCAQSTDQRLSFSRLGNEPSASTAQPDSLIAHIQTHTRLLCGIARGKHPCIRVQHLPVMRTKKQRNNRNTVRGSRLNNRRRTLLEVLYQESFGGFSAEDINHNLCSRQLSPPKSVINPCRRGIDGPQEKRLSAPQRENPPPLGRTVLSQCPAPETAGPLPPRQIPPEPVPTSSAS